VALTDASLWDETFEQWLADTGGPITDKERAWADWVLDGMQGDQP
jgi:hypothetical protein